MTLPVMNEAAATAINEHRCLWCGGLAAPNSRYCSKIHGTYYVRSLKKASISTRGRRKVEIAPHHYELTEVFCANAKRESAYLLVRYGLEALQAPLDKPGTCQLCGQLRALDGAFCLDCADDLRQVGVL